MKKIMMSIAIAMVAVAVNAGSITWTSNSLKTALPGGAFSGTALSGAIAYLFVGGAPDVGAIGTAIAAHTYTGAGNVATAVTTTLGAISKTGVGSYVSQNVTAYMVIFDSATIAGAGYFMVSSPITISFGSSGNKTYAFTTASATLPGSWTAVPEPTSMALLALGVAAIGLRRKFIK